MHTVLCYPLVEVSHVKESQDTQDTTVLEDQPINEQTWFDLYSWLLPIVEKWVYCADVATWRGQQRETAEDIVQEAVTRTFRYNQRAEHGEVPSIASLKSLTRTIAQNYFRDRRKKDWCLLPPPSYEISWEGCETYLGRENLNPSEIAVDQLILNATITDAARLMVKFPPRQRDVLLTDLANLADFGEQPSLLEQALIDEGIQLRDYRHPLPSEPLARNRHAALLCIAYKRLRREVAV
jgi:DNA-directed RNA polymerase specialized sigma24 family protein